MHKVKFQIFALQLSMDKICIRWKLRNEAGFPQIVYTL